jgi:myo-inositol-1-phosphate synthase
MKEQERLESKKISKTKAVTSQLSQKIKPEDIYIGPSDFIPFLGNTKLAFIRLEGRMYSNIPFSIELRLEVDDKANSGGITIDAIRLARLALDRKIGGSLISSSAYFMKSPPIQFTDEKAREMVEEFISGKREK